MKKCILHGVALAAFASLVLTVQAQEQIDQSQFPTILEQPVDACPPVGGSVTFSVQATNADGYQWYRNNTVIDGETNSSLTLTSLSANDVGYYSATAIKGAEAVPTRAATLNVYIVSGSSPVLRSGGMSRLSATSSMLMSPMDLGGGGVVTVFGLPVVSSSGAGGCPGPYSGYVNYIKPMGAGWGFAPTTGTTIHTANDGNRSDTKVQAVGYYGDIDCTQTTVTVPNPAISPTYRFSIYFPRSTQVPTNSYPITLVGFDQ